MIEEASHLNNPSSMKKARDDFHLSSVKIPLLDFPLSQPPKLEFHHTHLKTLPQQTKLQHLKEVYEGTLGENGLLAAQLAKRRHRGKQEKFSLSLISAISHGEVIANQLVEGGVDTSVYEHFIFRMMEYVHTQERFRGRPVILLMDNASIHKHAMVAETVLAMKAILLFNPQYSPFLNPVEMFFKRLKREIQLQPVLSR